MKEDNDQLEWFKVGEVEEDDAGDNIRTHRARVPGGWLYRAVWEGSRSGYKSVSLAFVPEPKP